MKRVCVSITLILLLLLFFLFLKTRFAVTFEKVGTFRQYAECVKILGEPMYVLKLDDPNDIIQLQNISRESDWEDHENSRIALFPVKAIPYKYIFVIYQAESGKIQRVGWFQM